MPPFSQKITIDTSGKRSFAVASVPAKYSSREPLKLHKGVTREADQPPKAREAEKTAPWLISQASIEESESSYQRHVISHTDYTQMDSPATTTASTTNVKGKGSALTYMQAGNGSSKASIESSSSLSMSEGDRAGCSSTPLQHSGRKREREGDGMMLRGGEGEQEETAHPQSAARVLEVDMRFSSEPLDMYNQAEPCLQAPPQLSPRAMSSNCTQKMMYQLNLSNHHQQLTWRVVRNQSGHLNTLKITISVPKIRVEQRALASWRLWVLTLTSLMQVGSYRAV